MHGARNVGGGEYSIFYLIKNLDHERYYPLVLYCQDKEIGVILFSGLIGFVFYMNAAPSEFYFYWIWFVLVIAWVRNCRRAQHHRKKDF